MGGRIAPPTYAKAPQISNLLPDPSSMMSPFMLCSLPSLASGADQVSRQFYNGTTLPYYRILPSRPL
jgi:hypothetical protein